jgi:hypothetical protein
MKIVDPIRKFVISKNGSQEVVTILCATANHTVGSDRTVVAAVTGKRIRVMGFSCYNGSSASTYNFKSNSGGTVIFRGSKSINTTVDLLPITETGYFETSTGHGLFLDVGTAAVDLNVYYITYTP